MTVNFNSLNVKKKKLKILPVSGTVTPFRPILFDVYRQLIQIIETLISIVSN